MGTNYYAIPKLSDDEKLKVIQAVINNQMDEIRKLVPGQIHIGKSSSGWPFLFNHNNWEYYNTIDELKAFIENSEVIDEYGEKELDLWELVQMKQKIPITMFTQSEYSAYYIIKDGYGFSTSTEFS
jgi:hypothetical protein